MVETEPVGQRKRRGREFHESEKGKLWEVKRRPKKKNIEQATRGRGNKQGGQKQALVSQMAVMWEPLSK